MIMKEIEDREEWVIIKPKETNKPYLRLGYVGKAEGFREYLKTLKHLAGLFEARPYSRN